MSSATGSSLGSTRGVRPPAASAGSPAVGTPAVPRGIRAALVVACCLAVSVAGHLGGGGGIAPAAVAGAVPLAGLAAWWGACCRWSFGRLLTVFGAAQLGMHLVFTATGPAPGSGEAAGGAGMLLAHTGAALMLAAMLAYGEELLERLGDLLESMLTRWVPAAPRVAGFGFRSPRPRDSRPRRAGHPLLVGTVSRRGPPAGRLSF